MPLKPLPFTVLPLLELGIIHPGDNIGSRIYETCQKTNFVLLEKDILVIAQTIVSRAEGRIVDLAKIIPSQKAVQLAKETNKRPELVEVILQASKRVVRAEQGHLIVETPHGFVCANAGVDSSNVPGENHVTLLPKNPDASAQKIRSTLQERFNIDVAVIISDTHGRPFRRGAINVAIGTAGLVPVRSYVGQKDLFGYTLRSSDIAVADELASAAELLMGEADEGIAVVIIRGYPYLAGTGTAQILVRDPERDIFRR
jgi:coenzyme F420-0:L-glutamate ligase/coenzyme F420-1:gamma-L-glutamate ligase